MQGKTILVTGANQGVGKAAAVALAKQGADITIVSRNAERGRAASADIQAAGGGRPVDLIVADLSSRAEVHRVAAEFRARHSRLDVLVNNAGVYVPERHVTVDGLEETLAVNHLAYFVLTRLLVDLIGQGERACPHRQHVVRRAHPRQDALGRPAGCPFADTARGGRTRSSS